MPSLRDQSDSFEYLHLLKPFGLTPDKHKAAFSDFASHLSSEKNDISFTSMITLLPCCLAAVAVTDASQI